MLYRTMIVFKILKVEDYMTKYSDTERCFLKDVFFYYLGLLGGLISMGFH